MGDTDKMMMPHILQDSSPMSHLVSARLTFFYIFIVSMALTSTVGVLKKRQTTETCTSAPDTGH